MQNGIAELNTLNVDNSLIVGSGATTLTISGNNITIGGSGSNQNLNLLAQGSGNIVIGPSNSFDSNHNTVIGNNNVGNSFGTFTSGGGNNNNAPVGTCIGHYNNTGSSGNYSVAIGSQNISNGTSSITIGQYNNSSGNYSVSFGNNTYCPHHGELAWSSNGGMGQASNFTLFTTTTTNAPLIELTTDGLAPSGALPINIYNKSTTNRFLLEKKTYSCDITVSARQTGGSNFAMFKTSLIVSIPASGSGTLILSAANTPLLSTGWTASGPSVSYTLGTSPNALEILVTGLASTTINWVASVTAVIVNVN